MDDPVNPTVPPRRIVDENVQRKRSTDPRLRVGALGVPSGAEAQPPPPAPPPLVVTPTPPPAFLGLPGQAAPATPDFDAPTVAQELPVPTMARIDPPRSAPPPPASIRIAADAFDDAPATLIEPQPHRGPSAPAAPAAPPPAPSAPGDGVVISDDDGFAAPAIRPAIEAPEFTSGGRPKPVRERRATAAAMPVPADEGSTGGPPRPPAPLDPPVEPSTPRPRAMALDPPIEPSTPRPRPMALDPPVEPSTPRSRPAGLDPAVPPPGRIRSRADDLAADVPPEASGANARPAPPKAPLPLGTLGAVAAVVAVILIVANGAGDSDHRYSRSEERRLADLWLEGGASAWGGVRQDGVARAVENVGAGVARAMDGQLGGRTPRFVVLNDDIAAQSFALPDGTVVVTTAALRRLGSEAQLAALLAHSLAHVALGDVAAALDRATDVEPAVRAALEGGPPKAAIELAAAAATAPQSAPRELEADALALEALARADFSPAALADVIRNFGVRGGARRAAWLTLHPDDPARTQAANAATGGGRTNETEYATRVLDQIGRHGAAATPTPTTTKPPEATGKKGSLRTLPTSPGGATPPRPPTTAPAGPLAPPDEAPP